MLEQGQGLFPRLTHLWLDAGYKGKSKEWIENVLGWTVEIVQHPPKIAPAEVMRVWVREWAREGVVIDWEKPLPPRGFKVLPRRWVVERTLAWLNRFRRLKVRYERRDNSHQAFLDLGCALICWRYVQRF